MTRPLRPSPVPSLLTARPRLPALLLGLLSGLAAGNSLAAPNDVASLLPLSLEELIATPVITASRRAEGREQTPAHIMVITREQIRDRRYRNLADLLEDLPGVDFQRGTRSSTFNNFVFQGHVSNNKILILQDGVRIDHPAGGKIAVAENYSLLQARQVEVLYGPAAALYGADAFGGVINIITERAGSQPGGRVALGAGRFDSKEGEFFASARLSDEIGIAVGGHRQMSDRAPLDEYYPKSFPKTDAKTFAGQVVIPAAQREDYSGAISSGSQYLRLDVGEAFTLGYYRNHFRNLTNNGDTTTTSLMLDDAYWDAAIDTWHAKYRFKLSPDLSSELVLEQSEYKVNPDTRYVNVFTDFQDHGYDYVYARRRGIEQTFNWRVDDHHTVLAGLGFRDYRAIETPDLPHPYDTSLAPEAQGMSYPNTDLPLTVFESRYRSRSGFLQWQAQWTPSLSTMVGVRHDWYSTYGDSVNPRVGVVWQPASGHYLKLLYGEAFRAPAPEETLSAFGTFSGKRNDQGLYLGSNFRVPNTELDPEKSRNLSLTWDWRPRRDFNLVTNLYLSHVSDVITTRDEAVSTQYIPGALLSKTTAKQNSGRDVYRGVDLIPQWQVDLGGPWRADLWGSFSLIAGKVRETPDGVDWEQTNIATRKLKLGTTFRYQDWLTITPRVMWVGDTTTGRKNTLVPGERVSVEGYSVASLHVGMHKLAGGNVSVYLDVDNLFDARYYAAHGSSSSTQLAVPQQPRTVSATVEYRF